MSIVKMKRLRLVGMSSDREELLQQLQHLGCVEISEPTEKLNDPEWAALLTRPEDSRLAEIRDQYMLVSSALNTLKKYAPVKVKLLAPRRTVTRQQFFDEEVRAFALSAAKTLRQQEQRIASLYAEQSKLKTQILALAPWLELDVPLETTSTREVSVIFGSVRAGISLDVLQQELLAATQLVELIPAGKDKELQHIFLLYHKSDDDAVTDALKQTGFSRSALQGWTGTARENTRRLEGELGGLDTELEQAMECIAAHRESKEKLELCLDRLEQEIAREDAKSRLLLTQATFFLEGWITAPQLPEVQDMLIRYTAAWDAADPVPEQYPQVPVKLKNNPITRPLNMVTEMYSLPAYDGVDPNPLMAPFFYLFYGIMLADMGYGLIMMLIAAVVLKKARPRGGMHNFFSLMGLCGISTFVVGTLTGGFLGDFLPQLAGVINPNTTFTGPPALFTPLDNTIEILIAAMCLGAVHLITGMAISFAMKLRDGQIMDAVWEEVAWWVVFIGIALVALDVTKLVLILGGLMVVVGAGWQARGFGKVVAVFDSLYGHVTGFFGDILSYSRLMALMLAGGVIAQVFNTLGAIPGNVVFFLIVSLAGNALNFALNLLGCYVHDLRLQCLEFFGKFYKDGGRPFVPLALHTKYVDIEE